MPSKDILMIRELLAAQPSRDKMTIEELRTFFDAWDEDNPVPAEVSVIATRIADVPVEWISAENAREDFVFLYLHGGGYVIGSPLSHRHLVAALSEETGIRGLLVDYRLAPEHPFPAAVEDALAVYSALLKDGYSPDQIVVGGDSAGGGLAISLLLAVRDAKLPQPAAGICLSPWTDLTGSAESLETNAAVDPTVTKEFLQFFANHYLGEEQANNIFASPIFANLDGLPPLLIQVGSVEVLLDDSTGIAKRAKEADVPVTLEVWEQMIHVWHRYYPILQEGREANARIGEYVRDILSRHAVAAE